MNTQLARRAIRLFANDLAAKRTRHHNARQWLRAVQILGDKWVVRPEQHIKKGVSHE